MSDVKSEPAQSDPKMAVQAFSRPALTPEIVDRDLNYRIAELEYRRSSFDFLQRQAQLYAQSNLFGKVDDKNVDKATAIARAAVRIELGRSMGIGEAEALQGIDIIQDRLAVSSAIRGSKMQQAGWTWDVQYLGTLAECTGCVLWMKYNDAPYLVPKRKDTGEIVTDAEGRPATEQVSVAFLKIHAEAIKTKIWFDMDNGKRGCREASILEKDNWKQDLRGMYFARAVTRAQKWLCPKAMSPALLTIEEARDEHHGDVTIEERTMLPEGDGSRQEQIDVQNRRLEELRRKDAAAATTAPEKAPEGEKTHGEKAEELRPPTEKAAEPFDYVGYVKDIAAIRERIGNNVWFQVLGNHGYAPGPDVKDMVHDVLMQIPESAYKAIISDLAAAAEKVKRSQHGIPEKGQTGFKL